MATATKTGSKRDFVREFLQNNPQGNVRAVNEAWTAAGMTGTIGATLIYELRAQMGLSAHLHNKSKPKTTSKAQSAAETPGSPGKTNFAKEFLSDHPQGNVDAVNRAWTAAGFEGTISATLINKLRASLGLAGNLRGRAQSGANGKATSIGKTRGRPRKETAVVVTQQPATQPPAMTSDRNDALLGLEVEIDKLIFQVIGLGNLPEVETTLREARRRVYRAFSS